MIIKTGIVSLLYCASKYYNRLRCNKGSWARLHQGDFRKLKIIDDKLYTSQDHYVCDITQDVIDFYTILNKSFHGVFYIVNEKILVSHFEIYKVRVLQYSYHIGDLKYKDGYIGFSKDGSTKTCLCQTIGGCVSGLKTRTKNKVIREINDE